MESPLEIFVGNDCEFLTPVLTNSDSGATISDSSPTAAVLTYPDGDALATPMTLTAGSHTTAGRFYGRITAAQTLLLERETKYIAQIKVNGGSGLQYECRRTFKVVNRP